MKRLWAAVALLAVLLALTLANAQYAQTLTGHMTDRLEQARQLAGEDQWEQAKKLTDEAFADWLSHHFYFHTVMRHADTDEILRSFRAVLQYLDLREMDQYAAANIDLITQLELLFEMEHASLANVL